MIDPYLTWMVPCRRAVVKQTVTYRTLASQWADCLWHYNEKLISWYDIDPHECLVGLVRVSNWIGSLPPRQLAVRREGGNPVDTPPSFYVRLWKGPLRVLLERAAGAAGDPHDVEVTIGTEPKTLSETRIQYGGESLILQLDPEHKDVWNTNARFLMGDVVEFPMAKFLVASDKTEYADITFNPNGNFFCGTSLLEGDDVRGVDATPKIHENFIAMRFQLLLNLLRGAFYSRQAVFASGTARAPIARESSGEEEVHARGMVYGNSFGSPTRNIDDSEPDFWVAGTNNWGCVAPPGRTDAFAANLPNRAGRLALKLPGRDLPLTPSIACSPSALFLARYMLNLFCSAAQSVQHTLIQEERRRRSRRPRRDTPNPLYGKFEEIPLSEFRGDAETDQISENTAFKNRVETVLRRMGFTGGGLGERRDQPPFSRECLSNERTGALPRSMRTPLRNNTNRNHPGRAFERVNRFLGDAAGETPRDETKINTLNEMHRCLYDGFAEIRTELDQILQDDTWDDLGISRPDIDITVLPNAPHAPQPCTEAHGITHEVIREICQSLNSKRNLLNTRGGVWQRDVSEIFADINMIDRPSHELSIVKVYPFDRLMARDTLPLSDRMAAYDPLSGEPCCEETPVEDPREPAEDQQGPPAEADPAPPSPATDQEPAAEETGDEADAQQARSLSDVGQLYIFEASDALLKWLVSSDGRTKQCCGIAPFKWEKIENNILYFKIHERKLNASTRPGGDGKIQKVFKAIDATLRQRYPDNEAGGLVTDGAGDTPETVWTKPIAVLGLSGSGVAWRGQSGTLGPHNVLMADRAVPFPTMQEVDTCFPRVSATPAQAQHAHDAVETATRPFLPSGSRHAATLSSLESLGREALLTTSVPTAHHTTATGRTDSDVRIYHNNARVVKIFCATLHGGLAGGRPAVSNQEHNQFMTVLRVLSEKGDTWFGAARATPVRNTMASLRNAINALQGIAYKTAISPGPGEPSAVTAAAGP